MTSWSLELSGILCFECPGKDGLGGARLGKDLKKWTGIISLSSPGVCCQTWSPFPPVWEHSWVFPNPGSILSPKALSL